MSASESSVIPIVSHRHYIQSILDSGNEWINKLLDTTGMSADILMLYQCLRDPNRYNYQRFKRSIKGTSDEFTIFTMKQIISNLNTIINNAPKSEVDITVWRGVTLDTPYPERDSTMLSTSINYQVANSFSNPNYIHKIIIPAGNPFLYVETHSKTKGEYEIVLPFGCIFSEFHTSKLGERDVIERVLEGVQDVDDIVNNDLIDALQNNKSRIEEFQEREASLQSERIAAKLARLSKKKATGTRGRRRKRKSRKQIKRKQKR